MRKRFILVLILALAMVTIGIALTYAGGRGFHNRGPRPGMGDGPFGNLTEEQRTAIREKVQELRNNAATREEIRTEVREMLEGWGIEVPERMGERSGRGDGPFADLTEEQRAPIRETIKTMRENGATREEIRAAVLQQYGIALPEKLGLRHRPGRFGFRGLRDRLTEEQRAEIHQMIEGMKADNASREEIRAAVRAKLEEWGVELPERQGPFADLTEDQRAEIRATIKTMREEGATREEIRVAVRDLLEGYSIEQTENPDAEAASKTALTSTSISQNTPNPFNPTTTIAYDLSEPANVTLRVYAVTGQEVATLVSDYQPPGHYEATWDGSGFANGMYLYRLEAGPYTATKRMLLLK